MKRLIAFVLSTCLMLCSAACAESFVYTQESVTDSANTQSLYDAFYASGELSVLVPGLKQTFVPQGLSYLPEKNWMNTFKRIVNFILSFLGTEIFPAS